MIYTDLTVKAMNIAYQAHHGVKDKNGVPYIFHPIHVAEQMKDEYTTCVALLHDVVEDTDFTIEQLEEIFPKPVTDAVRLLTHDKNKDYFDYILPIKSNPVALAVKLADIAHNSDASRNVENGLMTEQKWNALQEKYAKALKILNE